MRHPLISAIKLMTGAPITAESDMPAITHPMALALFSRGKRSPIIEKAVGTTIAIPNPDNEYDTSNVLKLDARPLPKADKKRNRRPINSNDLCLNLILKTPIANAETTVMIEERE